MTFENYFYKIFKEISEKIFSFQICWVEYWRAFKFSEYFENWYWNWNKFSSFLGSWHWMFEGNISVKEKLLEFWTNFEDIMERKPKLKPALNLN